MVLGVPVFAVIYRYIDKLTIRQLKHKEKPVATSDYISLEAYGINEDEIAMEPGKQKGESIIKKIRKKKK